MEYLGEAAYYLDGVIDRLPGGSEAVGGIHKWVIDCNWKMPAEQFASDMYHAATSHISAITVNMPEDFDPLQHSMDQRDGVQYWSEQGHGGGYFYAERPNPAIWLQPLAKEWLASTYEKVVARLGAGPCRTRQRSQYDLPQLLLAGRHKHHSSLAPTWPGQDRGVGPDHRRQ
ncbi:SRPBCC family protein [Nocardioides sp. B-3]|uniref:SRPBCC family protein n=1 Tax=Nocardioides sp. B-3 TaxID=2895565 RepID=UPI0021526897|nr:SRPBCC family protein [Nocardioides sp. B-3]UUZ59521.1 hypothetical protein LP418_27735 [Nocardioides sp. B-3]